VSLSARRPLSALFASLAILGWVQPAYANQKGHPSGGERKLSTQERIALYSPRARRATITYLRLRLLELREEDLDRARAVIERRLSVDELLAPPAKPHAPP
jgi:hypothetical protein